MASFHASADFLSDSLDTAGAAVTNYDHLGHRCLLIVHEFDAFDRASDHAYSVLAKSELTGSSELEEHHRALVVTEGVLVIKHVCQGSDFVLVVLVDEVGCAMSSTEDQVLVCAVYEVRIAYCHHHRAAVTTSRSRVAKLLTLRCFYVCFNHACLFDLMKLRQYLVRYFLGL